jgi:hypothetical protein
MGLMGWSFRGLASSRRRDLGRATGRALPFAFIRFLLPIGLAVDAYDLGAMHQPVDERDDTGRVGEDLAQSANRRFVVSTVLLCR